MCELPFIMHGPNLHAQKTFHQLALHLQSDVRVSSILRAQDKHIMVIVGAGPAGLATSVYLSQHSIPNVILKKEDIYASHGKKCAYDQLKLHLANKICELPFMMHGPNVPIFISKELFIN
ncbi:hypothetical protein YC2023_109182 [Brassica napus]